MRQKIVLKERTVTGNSPIYKSWINEKISEYEAKSIAKKLLDFMAQKEGYTYSVSSASKNGNIWKVNASARYQNIIIESISIERKCIIPEYRSKNSSFRWNTTDATII